MNLKESAQAYEPPQTLNISELDKVPLDIEVTTESHKDNEGKDFEGLYATVAGKKYRIPYSVLKDIKGIMTKMPNVKYVTVSKTGQGMATRYQVMPFVE